MCYKMTNMRLFIPKVSLILFTLGLGLSGAAAQAAPPIAAGLKVFPVKVNLKATAGKKATAVFEVVNTATRRADVAVTVADFVRDDKGNYRFFDRGKRPESVSTAAWTKISPARLRLGPDGVKQVRLVVAAPAGAEPGGHFAMAFVTATPLVDKAKTPKGTIIGKARVGVMIRATVKGSVVDKARLARLEAPRLSWGGPVDFTLVFANDGNIHKDIAGVITVARGGAKVARIPVDEWTSLPGSDLRITKSWARPRWGSYRVKALVASRDGQEWTKTARIYVVPLAPLLWLLAIVSGLFVIWRFVLRRYDFKVEKK